MATSSDLELKKMASRVKKVELDVTIFETAVEIA